MYKDENEVIEYIERQKESSMREDEPDVYDLEDMVLALAKEIKKLKALRKLSLDSLVAE